MWCLQIANALYYNPSLTLETLNKLGVAVDIFNHWFAMLQQVKKSGARVNFKRYGCLLCTVIFHVPSTYDEPVLLYCFICREHDKKVLYYEPVLLYSFICRGHDKKVLYFFFLDIPMMNQYCCSFICREHDKKVCC
jgi:hypothetical protein